MQTAIATELIVIVPCLPPTANHMYRPNGRGGRLLTDEAKAFRVVLGAAARQAARLAGWQMPSGPLRLAILLTFDDRRKADIDNRCKAALDALAIALEFDDARVDEILIRRVGVEPRRPRCELILAPRERNLL